jgi:hypothetical protein
MVWDVSFTCDMCGKQKGESNHWWMARLEQPASPDEPRDQPRSDDRQANQGHNGGPVASSDGNQYSSGRFTLVRWSAESCCDSNLHHLCGQGCAMQALARFMTLGSFYPEGARCPEARHPDARQGEADASPNRSLLS